MNHALMSHAAASPVSSMGSDPIGGFDRPSPNSLSSTGTPSSARRSRRANLPGLTQLLGSLLLGAVLSGCGGGGSSLFNNTIDPGGNPGPDSASFLVVSVLPQQGQIWEVNRPIEVTFNKDVNPASISAASISIQQTLTGVPALGSYSIVDKRTVVFQPTCPTTTSVGGLVAGGVSYTITVAASAQGGSTTVTSTGGDPIAAGKTTTFTTKPTGLDGFFDPKVNTAPSVSEARMVVTNTDGSSQILPFNSGTPVPANKFVGPSILFDLTFDQPIDPSAVNISTTNISLRFENPAGSGVYAATPVKLQLIENCTAAGARVRVTPLGLLPNGRRLRFVIAPGFSDIKGETSLFPQNVPSTAVTEPVVEAAAPPDFDAIRETFDSTAFLDAAPGFIEPPARWEGDGILESGFAFGGKETDLELDVQNGSTVIIDTNSATIQLKDPIGNPVPATFVNGRVFLRKLTVRAGGLILGQGPNPLRFFVNETVLLEPASGPIPAGRIQALGAKGPDVATLFTAAVFSEKGGPGQCGGGDGGVGNPVTSQSSVKGGPGNGPFNSLNGGGEGGESAIIGQGATGPCFDKEDRHPAGGGGGSNMTFGEKANDGTPVGSFTTGSCSVAQGVSAVNPASIPIGGNPGPLPFQTPSVVDDFFGVSLVSSAVITSTGSSTITIKTTTPLFLTGASGDAGRYVLIYRTSGFWEETLTACNASGITNPASCFLSKLQVRQIQTVPDSSTITFAAASPLPVNPVTGDLVILMGRGPTTQGEIVTPLGGQGGGGGGNAIGATTISSPLYGNQDKKGAGGGGGGGVIEIFSLGLAQYGGVIDASGGDGGAGENTIFLDRIGGGSGGGAGGSVRVESATQVDTFVGNVSGSFLARGGRRGPGQDQSQQDPAPPTSAVGLGHGGRGGKGLVQIHSPIDPVTKRFKTNFLNLGATIQPLSSNFDPAPHLLPASFGGITRSRSLWFDTGLQQVGGLPTFEMSGLSLPSTPQLGPVGKVLTDVLGNIDTSVPIVATGTVPSGSVTANSVTLLLSDVIQAPLNLKANEPLTLLGDLIRVGATNRGAIIGVSVVGSSVILTTDNGTAGNPTLLNAGVSGTTAWQLIARYFEVCTFGTTGELKDFVPPTTNAFAPIRVQIQGADATAQGGVDLATVVPNVAADPEQIGTSDMTVLTGKRFVRFTVTFDIAPGTTPTPSAPKIRLKFLKLPFRFN